MTTFARIKVKKIHFDSYIQEFEYIEANHVLNHEKHILSKVMTGRGGVDKYLQIT